MREQMNRINSVKVNKFYSPAKLYYFNSYPYYSTQSDHHQHNYLHSGLDKRESKLKNTKEKRRLPTQQPDFKYHPRAMEPKQQVRSKEKFKSRSPGKIYYNPRPRLQTTSKSPRKVKNSQFNNQQELNEITFSRKGPISEKKKQFAQKGKQQEKAIVQKCIQKGEQMLREQIKKREVDWKFQTSFQQIYHPSGTNDNKNNNKIGSQLLQSTRQIKENQEDQYKKIEQIIKLSKRLFPSPPSLKLRK